MKKLFKIALILLITGIIAAGLIWKFYINKPHADIENTAAAYSLQATELWKQYNADLKLADSLYTGQVIEVIGQIGRVESNDSLAYVVFVMEADSMFGDKSIRCELLPNYKTEGSGLTEGSAQKIKGFCNGYDQTDIKLSKCSIIK